MTTTKSLLSRSLAALSASILICTAAQAQTVVYDNGSDASRYKNFVYNAGDGVLFGDQITLAGSARTVTEFRFDYFAAGLSGSPLAEVYFWKNDGPIVSPGVAAPGSVLYQSGTFSVSDSFNTVTISDLSVDVPDSFTWGVVFSGLGGGESGLLVYDPPVVGSSLSDFWQKVGDTWPLRVLSDGTPANFGARIVAVPEPSTFVLAGLAIVFGYFSFRRRSV
jgi:hypothetical protein